MTGIIWYYTSQAMGQERLKQLIQDYKSIKIETVKLTNNSVLFDNGDFWKIVSANSNSKGCCCNVGLIESGTSEKIIHTLIMPCIKARPYRAYGYY